MGTQRGPAPGTANGGMRFHELLHRGNGPLDGTQGGPSADGHHDGNPKEEHRQKSQASLTRLSLAESWVGQNSAMLLIYKSGLSGI